MVKCKICDKSVYPMDPQINLDGIFLHKTCAKCADCKCQITLSNFVKNDGGGSEYILLCKTHHLKRFHEQGSYIGAEKYRVQAVRDVHALNKPVSDTKSVVSEEDSASISTQEKTPLEPLSEEEQKIPQGSVKAVLAQRRKSQIEMEAKEQQSPKAKSPKALS